MYCVCCGMEVHQGEEQCPYCGNSLSDENSSAPEVIYEVVSHKETKCPQCGDTVSPEARFCGACGCAIIQPKPIRIPRCVACGELLSYSAAFCLSCGLKYVESADGYIEIPKKRICQNCGAELREDMQYCMQCGATVTPDLQAVKKTLPSCRKCGSIIRSNRPFCKQCGALWSRCLSDNGVYPIVEGEYLKCPICGKDRMKNNRKKCWNCGVEFILSNIENE